ncbi:MAG TPA: arginine deiminase-related protein [Caulobacteraceae bacterium]|jgi:N-dimethylarginine dimethylaminohydrolase
MAPRPLFLLTDPEHFEVSYRINPWMNPSAWSADPDAFRARAAAAARALKQALIDAGAEVETIAGVKGLPDLVFPANAAVVLDSRVAPARFRHRERQGEEKVFRAVFEGLRRRGLLQEIVDLPEGLFQEGAGDAIWDADRALFWVGYGPRSSPGSAAAIAQAFGQAVAPLALASARFYHLDTCFCPLAGGAVLYYPPAFTPEGLDAIRQRVPEALRIEASSEEAAAFCVNAVNLGTEVIMAKAPASLKRRLSARGYRIREVDLAPFILSGGGAYCMTLRLDRTSRPASEVLAAE